LYLVLALALGECQEDGKMRDPIDERLARVHEAVVRAHIRTGQPVGSRYLCGNSRMGMSSASIRSLMAGLEGLGLLRKPHTSAGRIPTEKGYRLFVDRMMTKAPVSRADARSIRKAIETAPSLEEMLEHLCRSLETLSHQAGVAVLPRAAHGVIARIETSAVSRRGILMRVYVEPGGERTLSLRLASDDERVEASRLLGRIAAGLVGKDTRKAAETLRRASRSDAAGGALAKTIRAHLSSVLESAEHGVHVTGTGNLVSAMKDTAQAGSLLEVLESRDTVTRLLLSGGDETGATVRIGSENMYTPMRSCSIIRSTYRIGNSRGAIGIIGPLRMEYSRFTALVEYTSSELTRLLAD
jgi:heat-inducible transcriptional repressor